MRMTSLFLLPLSLWVTSCGTSVETTEGSNGRPRHSIKCENYVQRCYDKANDLCPHGYLVLNRVRGVKVKDDTEYTLVVKCRNGKVFF